VALTIPCSICSLSLGGPVSWHLGREIFIGTHNITSKFYVNLQCCTKDLLDENSIYIFYFEDELHSGSQNTVLDMFSESAWASIVVFESRNFHWNTQHTVKIVCKLAVLHQISTGRDFYIYSTF
jgi:hypothetical protein